ncbi:class D sortase [Anaerosporobacter faecicola]|uniref:class D sortase n=1 Tax=Anaerosporobacter faecicola TaxID=2718714 RepID=UPI00143C129C|nr:class D sortase [Anaerosporobacter faecicola]
MEKKKVESFLAYREIYQQSIDTTENIKSTEDQEKTEGNETKTEPVDEESQDTPTSEDGDIDQERAFQTETAKDGLIGILYIDRINLRVAIAEGTDKEALRYSVGHFENTVFPGEKGNACFTGHRSYAFGQYFNRLDEMQVGDRIKILTLDQILEYEVTESFVVEPEDTWVLDPTEEEIITLITCTPVRIATHRLIVRAKRV